MLIEEGFQHTLAREVEFSGRGLHSGKEVRVRVRPSPEDTGFVFCRPDIEGCPEFKASPEEVSGTDRATTLGRGRARVGTVEHFLAAASVLELDNLRIDVEGPELPIFDGSPEPFYRFLQKGGRERQELPRRLRRIEAPYFVRDERAWLVALPLEGFRVTYTFIAPPPIGNQVLDREESWDELLPARTFGWKEELEELRSRGLIKGGSEDCALLFSREGKIPEYRVEQEPAAHKIVDLLGDLAVYRPLLGHIIAFRAGHGLHHRLLSELEKGEGR